MNSFWKQVSAKFPIKGTPWTFSGYSVAARNTIIIINELGIAFDCGLETDQNLSHIFISHTHLDHVKATPQYIIDPSNGKIPIVIIPKPSASNFKSFVTSAIAMTKHEAKFSVKMQTIEVSLKPKEKSAILPDILIVKNIRFRIEIIRCNHSTPTTGYGLIEIRSKLKDEYKGLSQIELNALKQSGIEICYDVEIPHFCYLGDTDHKVLGDPDKKNPGSYIAYNKCLEKYFTIFVECTFYDSVDISQAKSAKHMHWIWLEPYIRDHPNTQFVLYHFSMRYKPKNIIEFFSSTGIPNITLLVHDFDEIHMSSVEALIKTGKFTPEQLRHLSELLPVCHSNEHHDDAHEDADENTHFDSDAVSYGSVPDDD